MVMVMMVVMLLVVLLAVIMLVALLAVAVVAMVVVMVVVVDCQPCRMGDDSEDMLWDAHCTMHDALCVQDGRR